MGRPVHFEIQADDIERAKKFYAEVFGWSYVDYG
ncbi:MAG: VOC family protein, partial [Youngiibacter sp.]|nr:VOC family protein [Youngiibacter sp.]